MNLFGLAIISASAFLALTAAWQASRPSPNHPFVEKFSRLGCALFLFSSLMFLVSVAINFRGFAEISIAPAFVGLIFLAAGWMSSQKESKNL